MSSRFYKTEQPDQKDGAVVIQTHLSMYHAVRDTAKNQNHYAYTKAGLDMNSDLQDLTH